MHFFEAQLPAIPHTRHDAPAFRAEVNAKINTFCHKLIRQLLALRAAKCHSKTGVNPMAGFRRDRHVH
jgi:hypothetical protein